MTILSFIEAVKHFVKTGDFTHVADQITQTPPELRTEYEGLKVEYHDLCESFNSLNNEYNAKLKLVSPYFQPINDLSSVVSKIVSSCNLYSQSVFFNYNEVLNLKDDSVTETGNALLDLLKIQSKNIENSNENKLLHWNHYYQLLGGDGYKSYTHIFTFKLLEFETGLIDMVVSPVTPFVESLRVPQEINEIKGNIASIQKDIGKINKATKEIPSYETIIALQNYLLNIASKCADFNNNIFGTNFPTYNTPYTASNVNELTDLISFFNSTVFPIINDDLRGAFLAYSIITDKIKSNTLDINSDYEDQLTDTLLDNAPKYLLNTALCVPIIASTFVKKYLNLELNCLVSDFFKMPPIPQELSSLIQTTPSLESIFIRDNYLFNNTFLSSKELDYKKIV